MADHEVFKIYLLDVGLLAAMCRLPARVIVDGDQLFVEFKGSFTENYVAQALKAALRRPLYYWASEREAEVDFLVEWEGTTFSFGSKIGHFDEKKESFSVPRKISPSPALSLVFDESKKRWQRL